MKNIYFLGDKSMALKKCQESDNMVDCRAVEQLPEDTQEQVCEYKNCPFCGELILSIAKKCKYCGEFLHPKSMNLTKRKKNMGGLITFAILVVAILFGYMYRYTILFYAGTILDFNGGQLSYMDPLTNSEAQNLGKLLTEQGVFDGRNVTVLLTKSDNIYEVRLVTKKVNLQDYSQAFSNLGEQISKTVFGGKPVDIHLCDEWFRTKLVIPCSYER